MPGLEATNDRDVVDQALRIARAAVVADIELQCPRTRCGADGTLWFDTRPMLDPREHAPAVLDMADLSLRFALHTGLVVRHPHDAHLVRIVPHPQA